MFNTEASVEPAAPHTNVTCGAITLFRGRERGNGLSLFKQFLAQIKYVFGA